MGLLDKLIQMKTDHDAQKAQEAAENLALCNRLRQNQIFLNFADFIHDLLANTSSEPLKWVSGASDDAYERKLAIVVTSNDFAFVASYFYRDYFYDSEGESHFYLRKGMKVLECHSFEDYGMQSLPNRPGVIDAVLETLASRLKEIPYIFLEKGDVETDDGHSRSCYHAVLINVSSKGLNQKRSAW